jgi:hypothetical protein
MEGIEFDEEILLKLLWRGCTAEWRGTIVGWLVTLPDGPELPLEEVMKREKGI